MGDEKSKDKIKEGMSQAGKHPEREEEKGKLGQGREDKVGQGMGKAGQAGSQDRGGTKP